MRGLLGLSDDGAGETVSHDQRKRLPSPHRLVWYFLERDMGDTAPSLGFVGDPATLTFDELKSARQIPKEK
jgi:hypothetical protein